MVIDYNRVSYPSDKLFESFENLAPPFQAILGKDY
jgi:hypothetical protein